MTRSTMSSMRRIDRPRPPRRRRGLGSLSVWILIAAVVGTAAFVVACAASTDGGDKEEFAAEIVETPSDPSGGQPFEGGARLYLPVEGVDLGQVPFHKVVSHAFDLTNVGDAPLGIEDVQVTMLEGC